MVVKNSVDLTGLRRANRETLRLRGELAALVRPGMTHGELDAHAIAYLARIGAKPSSNIEIGFPGCTNTSVNDAVFHGVPGSQILRAGDIISIDAGMRLKV